MSMLNPNQFNLHKSQQDNTRYYALGIGIAHSALKSHLWNRGISSRYVMRLKRQLCMENQPSG